MRTHRRRVDKGNIAHASEDYKEDFMVSEDRKEFDLAELKVENASYPASNKYCSVDDGSGELE